TRRVSSHGVTPPRGTPCLVSIFVMGSFILRTPFNRSVPLARRARIYQSILFARRKTGKAKNDAMPPKVRMVAPDGKQVFEPSHHGHPWAKKWANLQPLYPTALSKSVRRVLRSHCLERLFRLPEHIGIGRTVPAAHKAFH